jgi:uncharacterized membrane protein YfcA
VELLLILGTGLAAGTLSGIVGFGSSIMMMPVLVLVFGPREAVPIMAIAALMANLSRVVVWRREIDWRAAGAYAATGIPGAALGAGTLVALPPALIEGALGAFFIAMIPARRRLAARRMTLGLAQLAAIGFGVGWLTGIVVSTGPITVPVFLAYGLVKGAFIGTEAAASLAVYASKVSTFRALGVLPAEVVVKGLATGASLTAGAFIARRFVLRFGPEQFRLLMDGLMLASGLTMLWAALR